MAIETIIDNASSVMTVVSLITFVGILWWVYMCKLGEDFDQMAQLPLVDDPDELVRITEKHHG